MHILTLLALLTQLSLGVQIRNFFPKPSFRYKNKERPRKHYCNAGSKRRVYFFWIWRRNVRLLHLQK